MSHPLNYTDMSHPLNSGAVELFPNHNVGHVRAQAGPAQEPGASCRRSVWLPLRPRFGSGADPLQFSREYNRLFGAPPLRDITNLRQMATKGINID